MISEHLLDDVSRIAAFLVLYLLLFFFAKWFHDVITPYKLNEELTEKDNLAISLTLAGYYFGLLAVFIGALSGPTQGLMQDLVSVGGYSLLGLLFLNASRYINDGIILRSFRCDRQLCEERNIAVGAVQFGMYLATGLIAAGSVHGTGGGVLTACVFFLIGQLSLFIFSLIYDFFTPYSIQEELKKKNIAAGAALGGTMIALGIIVCNGVASNFTDWESNLIDLMMTNILAFVFLPLVRIVMDKVVIPAADLSTEITEDRNLGAGLLEATVAISFAIVLVSVV
jgi:uncharacterized membrane protein YjfL (UPF0719 family)